MTTLDLTGETAPGRLWADRYSNSLMNTFGAPQRVLVRGEGCYVWDADGTRYLDLLGGIAVNSLGHAHPFLISTVSAQLGTLGHISNFFASPPQIALAERLLELSGIGDGRVFFTNSGTEANEAAFKIARRTGRPKIVAAENSFHGRTMGALALTGKTAIREPFEPMPAGVEHVPFGDVAALREAVDGETAAVFLEPVQGEAGVVPAPAGYLAAAREITAAHGVLLVFDEIQTGIGRTGDWFGYQAAAIAPDVITVAKGLAGGIPIGACLAFGEAAALLGPGSHGTTFGGNPVAAAAGLAVLHVIERDNLLSNVTTVGDYLASSIKKLDHPAVSDVRGRGLLLGIALAEPIAADVAKRALEAGFIVNPVNPQTIRLAPPLILTPEQADSFVTALPTFLPGVDHGQTPVRERSKGEIAHDQLSGGADREGAA